MTYLTPRLTNGSVFCEKPIATDLPETIEAINACNEAGVKLMTALQRRFDPNFTRVKAAIVGEEVGEVVQIKLCSRDPAPPPFEYAHLYLTSLHSSPFTCNLTLRSAGTVLTADSSGPPPS